MMARQTARKVRIWDIMSGTFVKKEGFEPSFVKTSSGEEVSRARVLGTVVSVFTADDNNFASVTIDDGSDTIRLKVFKTTKPLDSLNVGDVVDVVGKVREYNGEVYVIPEIAMKVEDPNFELMRRLELVRNERSGKRAGKTIEKGGEKSGGTDNSEKAVLKKEVLKIIGSSKDGMVYSELGKLVKAKEADLEWAVDELLNEGICYEPSPGKIRKI